MAAATSNSAEEVDSSDDFDVYILDKDEVVAV
jgi:hypothetical protein